MQLLQKFFGDFFVIGCEKLSLYITLSKTNPFFEIRHAISASGNSILPTS